jgi:alkylation response protein AidB-like acyl-CoA dehydrogenase
MVTAVALTEPDHGSDITDLATTAIREGNDYVVNGVKTLISNGENAGVVTVLCKTDPSASPAYRGFSLILVERERHGFASQDLGEKMGLHMTTTSEITLKNVRVPSSNLIGQENRGFYHTMEFLDQTRIEVAAQALGGAQAALDRAVAHLKERTHSGRRLGDFQINQHKLADMATKVEAARLITYWAAWHHDRRGPDARLASMAKLYAARIAVEVADETVQIFGGRGYFAKWDVDRIYRDVRVTEIYEGAREIQKNTIASSVLGK